MNCDDVFDLLTLGPLAPETAGHGRVGAYEQAAAQHQLAAQHQVAAHLETCPDCRQLAEAFRPAIELFEESAPPQEHYAQHGDLNPANWFSQPSRRASRYASAIAWQQGDLFRLAAALLIGLTLGSFLWNSESAAPRGSVAGSPISWNSHARWLSREVVMSLQLAEACLQPHRGLSTAAPSSPTSAASTLPASIQEGGMLQLACCTLCHSITGEAAAAQVTVAHLANSCQLCHTN